MMILAALIFSSLSFDFNGKVGHLKGDVSIDHPSGKVVCDEAWMDYDKAKGPVTGMKILGHIVLTRPDGSILTADEGDFDLVGESGVFRSHVNYKDHENTISSEEARFLYNKKEKAFTKLELENGVSFNHKDKYFGTGEKAVYENNQIILAPNGELKNKEGETLTGSEIRFDSKTETAFVSNPKGKLKNLDFSGESLQGEEGKFILKGHVRASQAGSWTMATENEVEIETDGKEFKNILCRGPAVITHIESQKGKSHTLTTKGNITADSRTGQVVIEGSQAFPVHFEDDFGEAFADKVIIQRQNRKIEKILLAGHVYLSHALNKGVERSYAKADRVEYDPNSFVMTLIGEDGQPVSLFDKGNQLQVSAPRLTVKRDQATKKETIQGEGDVKFELVEKELQELKKRFKFEESES